MIYSVSTKEKIHFICQKLAACATKLEKNTCCFDSVLMDNLDNLFSKLNQFIKTVPEDKAAAILADPSIKDCLPTVRWLRAEYEFEIEKIQALELLSSADPAAEIDRMITMDYAGSSIFDKSLSTKMGVSRRTCLVVGSGPLPTTALMLYNTYNLTIACLDLAGDSRHTSEKIFRAARMPYLVEHIVADIHNWTNFSSYDVVFINGLVGVSRDAHGETEKSNILEHLMHNIKHDCLLIMRSGYCLGQLFYPEIQPGVTVAETIRPTKLGRSSIVLFDLLGGYGDHKIL